MASEIHRFGTSEEDDEDMGLDVKEEDDDEEKNNTNPGGLVSTNSNLFQQTPPGGTRRCRPVEEKERTKIRERQRRAITAKILAGLRRHGNYNLRVRADINDVIAALAREAGWVVLPDGTTFPSRSQSVKPAGGTTNVAGGTTGLAPLRGVDYDSCQTKSGFVAASSPFDVSSSGQSQNDIGEAQNDPFLHDSVNTVDNRQILDIPTKLHERDFTGTPYVPVYVMLPLGVINMKCEVVDPDGIIKQLRVLKSINVDGIVVDCWWGIVEAHAPQEYNWNGYKRLFQIVRELKLKLKVVMSFHECGGNVGDDVCIPLPHWVAEIGRNNPDLFFTDKEGRRNPECLSWGIDRERVLRGRTAVEVYYDYMRSFRVEFHELFEDDVISMIEIGLGPCGELRYPSTPVKHGWRYPGIGEFQCYDEYLLKSLRKAAETRGQKFWSRGPENVGSYNSRPHETGFFSDGGDYDGYYGRFFLSWYSQVLVEHGERVLSLAKLAFEGTCIAAKLSSIYWWYKTASHAAELTAGFYNSCNRDGYASITKMLKNQGVLMNFSFSSQLEHLSDDAMADPEGFVWQVQNAAWDVCLPVSSENSDPCYDREGYNNLLEKGKPMGDPDGRHFSAFTYQRLTPLLMERHNIVEFERFVKRMHGEAVLDIPA